MADNETLTSGGVIAMDEVSINGITVKVGRNKLGFGADGTYTEVSSVNPFPVTGPLTDTQLRASAVPVSGTFWPTTQPVSGTVGVSGSVAVTGTFWQTTQPISAASLPLPTGAATAANQTTANTALAAIETAVEASQAALEGTLDVRPIPFELEVVPASSTDAVLGSTGQTGDYIHHIVVTPLSASPGAVTIKDGAGSAVTIFAGGTDVSPARAPLTIPRGSASQAGAWTITTGLNVQAEAYGFFT